MDDDLGAGVAEIGKRGDRMHPAGRLEPGEAFGRHDLAAATEVIWYADRCLFCHETMMSRFHGYGSGSSSRAEPLGGKKPNISPN